MCGSVWGWCVLYVFSKVLEFCACFLLDFCWFCSALLYVLMRFVCFVRVLCWCLLFVCVISGFRAAGLCVSSRFCVYSFVFCGML